MAIQEQDIYRQPAEIVIFKDFQLWKEYGGKRENWRDGLYSGSIEDKFDRTVAIKAIEKGELIVSCFSDVTYGILGDGYDSDIQEKIRVAKNAKKIKPISALIHPESLVDVIDPQAVGVAYPMLSDKFEFAHRFTSLLFVKAGILQTTEALKIAPQCFRQTEQFNGVPFETANMLTFIGDGPSGEFQKELSLAIARKHNLMPHKVWIPASSCNLSGRGSDEKKTPDHFEIVEASPAEQFARQSGIKVVLHSQNANKHRTASFEMWAVTPNGVFREREGNIRYGYARRLFEDVPLDLKNAKPTIKRNRPIIGTDAEVARLLKKNEYTPRDVGIILRRYYKDGILEK